MNCTHPIKLKFATRPCGRCMACRINYQLDWTVRLFNEFETAGSAVFLTLTYDDDHLPKNHSVSKREMQLWKKRFRKALGVKKVRVYPIGEYGDKNHRPHYHAIVYGISPDSECFKNRKYDRKNRGYWCECAGWYDEDRHPIGLAYVGEVTWQSCRYCARYCLKKQGGEKGKEHYKKLGVESPEFSLPPRRPGLGKDWCLKNASLLRHLGYVPINGKKFPLPRYYIDLLYDKESEEYKLQRLSDSQNKCVDAYNEQLKMEEDGLNVAVYVSEMRKQADKNLKAILAMRKKGALNK